MQHFTRKLFWVIITLVMPSGLMPLTIYAAPAQQEILFVSRRDGNAEIYRMHGNGDAQKNISYNRGTDWWPRLSLDGTRILVSAGR